MSPTIRCHCCLSTTQIGKRLGVCKFSLRHFWHLDSGRPVASLALCLTDTWAGIRQQMSDALWILFSTLPLCFLFTFFSFLVQSICTWMGWRLGKKGLKYNRTRNVQWNYHENININLCQSFVTALFLIYPLQKRCLLLQITVFEQFFFVHCFGMYKCFPQSSLYENIIWIQNWKLFFSLFGRFLKESNRFIWYMPRRVFGSSSLFESMPVVPIQ